MKFVKKTKKSLLFFSKNEDLLSRRYKKINIHHFFNLFLLSASPTRWARE